MIAFESWKDAFVPFVTVTVAKSLANVFKIVEFAAPGVNVARPPTVNTPLSVMFPAVLTVRAPVIVITPR